MITICGHEREALKWLLSEHNRLGVQGYTILRAHAQAKPQQLRYPEMAPFVDDITDPAKLAEMLAERGRELGFDVPGPSEQSFWEQLVIDPLRAWNQIRIELPENDGVLVMSMSQARAILLQWLQLPDGAREEAERILRSAT